MADDLPDYVETQLASHGVACVTVSDGHVLVFELATLEALTERAREAGRVVVFVKRAVGS
jgi:hypothetical protein